MSRMQEYGWKVLTIGNWQETHCRNASFWPNWPSEMSNSWHGLPKSHHLHSNRFHSVLYHQTSCLIYMCGLIVILPVGPHISPPQLHYGMDFPSHRGSSGRSTRPKVWAICTSWAPIIALLMLTTSSSTKSEHQIYGLSRTLLITRRHYYSRWPFKENVKSSMHRSDPNCADQKTGILLRERLSILWWQAISHFQSSILSISRKRR